MPTRMSVFLRNPGTLDNVKDTLAEILGHPLDQRDRGVGLVYTTSALDVEVRLFDEHGLEDDCGIAFTSYEYQLDLIPLESGLPVERFEPLYNALAEFLAARLSHSLSCQSIVVANLQRQVARFGGGRDR